MKYVLRTAVMHLSFGTNLAFRCREPTKTLTRGHTEGQPPNEGLTPRPPAACKMRGKVTTGLRP